MSVPDAATQAQAQGGHVGEAPQVEPTTEFVDLTPDEVEFIDAWRSYWSHGSPGNRAEVEAIVDVARTALGENFVRYQENARESARKPGFLGRARKLPSYVESSCAEIKRNLPGGVVGGMVGDALGAPVEFDPLERIVARFGPNGVVDLAPVFGRAGAVTDDTQMALFVLEALLMARVRFRHGKYERTVQPRLEMQYALAQWLHTQGVEWPHVLPPALRGGMSRPFGQLAHDRELHQQRSPDQVSMEALTAFALATEDNPHSGISDFHSPLNSAQGCGALSRAGMAAVWSDVPEVVFKLGATASLISHGHPDGYLPGGAFAVLAQYFLHGQGVVEALDATLYQLSRWHGHNATIATLTRALDVGQSGRMSPSDVDRHFPSSDHSAPDTLGIAVCAVLSHPDSFEDAVLAAVNHSGNSATAGAVCGTLMGLRLGVEAIPQRWRDQVELRSVADELVRNVISEFCEPEPPDSPEWFDRYLVPS